LNLKDESSRKYLRKPGWLNINLPKAGEYAYLREYLSKYNLHTICESGNCPNLGECWQNRTATFMILGDICTRACGFCAVKSGKPLSPDIEEPQRVAEVICQMKLKHVVITSVDRDDQVDGGSGIWASTIKAIKEMNPETTIETLIPDFKGEEDHLQKVIDAGPDIISHNLETVASLTKHVRKKAIYKRSLGVLRYISNAGMVTKSGIMVGLGETEEEVHLTMDDMLGAGCSIITIGQYLQPSKDHLPVERYVSPEEFEQFKKIALKKGFSFAECGPLVRSSYHAEKQI